MKYIIFDIDGTLTDTIKVDDKCFIASFEELFNVSIKDVSWNQFKNVTDLGITEELIKQKLERNVTQDDIKRLKGIFLSNINREFESDSSNFNEIEGAAKFYKSVLNDNNYKIGIATGGWKETADFKLNAIGINPNLVSYSNSNVFKEREKITLDVIEQLNSTSNTKPEEIIYLGDGEWDYRTCMNIGIRFIGIDSRQTGKLKKIGAEEVYANFKNPDIIMNSIIKTKR